MGSDKYPYPIFDWKDESKYQTNHSRSSSEWAWEFLRRNVDYQTYHGNYRELLIRRDESKTKNLPFNDGIRLHGTILLKTFYHEYYIKRVFNPSLALDIFKSDGIDKLQKTGIYSDLFFNDRAIDEMLRTHYSANELDEIYEETKYINHSPDDFIAYYAHRVLDSFDVEYSGDDGLIDPMSQVNPEDGYIGTITSGFSVYKKELDNFPVLKTALSQTPEKEGELVFKINVNKNIKDQMAFIKNIALSEREELGIQDFKRRDNKYNIYIRVLDALASKGLTATSVIHNEDAIDIVDTIKKLQNKGSHNSCLIDWKKASASLVKSGYLRLLLHSKK